ncbi:MAG: hypothetical protein M1828_004482 [Chrysothrix sp. TS-e1954]|nr:MAG: hypothetical protein M1828_004482 [Chrysothrix sp. TS-e1954]
MTATEYQHYVPRFLLRNYRFNKLQNKNAPRRKGKHKSSHHAADESPPVPDRELRDGLVREIDLAKGKLVETLLSETFGMDAMYSSDVPQDHTRTLNDIETRLSKLEGKASEIIASVKRDFDSGKHVTSLKRLVWRTNRDPLGSTLLISSMQDKNLLRKFLFIMHYRNKTFHSRFSKSLASYDADDRSSMIKFMTEQRLQHPIEVWFRNIAAILDADIEKFSDYLHDAPRLAATFHAYPPDMSWFLKNMHAYYLVFVKPQSPRLQFVLTENAYSVFEGPSSPQAWTDYHLFSPIAPSILIISRSTILGSGYLEDGKLLSDLRNTMALQHRDPVAALHSLLEDMPVQIAKNNYSQIVNGKPEALPTKVGRDKHVFYFSLFKISDHHVGLINSIFLDNAAHTSKIIYREPDALQAALDFYLESDLKGFKAAAPSRERVTEDTLLIKERYQIDRVPTLKYLKMLETVTKDLGSQVSLRHVTPLYMDPVVVLPPLRREMKRLHRLLGGSDLGYPYDWNQSKRLADLWIKIDVLKGKVESSKQNKAIREARGRFISEHIPLRRIWLLLKNLKELSRSDSSSFHSFTGMGLGLDGVEDTLADAHEVFEVKLLGRLMQAASQLEDVRERSGYVAVVQSSEDEKMNAKAFWEGVQVAFACGYIEDCGISSIREQALNLRSPLMSYLPRFLSMYRLNQALKTEQNIELMTRIVVAKSFASLDLRMSKALRGHLHRALFQTCYPTEITPQLASR